MNKSIILLLNLLVASAVASALLSSCNKVPPECLAYCERIEAWSVQCKKPKFSLESCKSHFECSNALYDDWALKCWGKMLKWSPNPEAEFECDKVTIPEL